MLCDISMKFSWQSHHYFDSLKELIDSVKFSERHLVKNNWISTATRIMLGQPLWDARLGKPDKWTAMGVYWWRECRVAAVSMLVICSLGCWTSAQLKCRYIYGDLNLTLQQKQNAGTHRSGQTWQQKKTKILHHFHTKFSDANCSSCISHSINVGLRPYQLILDNYYVGKVILWLCLWPIIA